MRWLLLEDPSLNCRDCEKFWEADREPPQCLTAMGCPIQDLAEDEEITDFIDQYLTAKTLHRVTEDIKTAQPIIEKLGLYEDPEFHLALENIYGQWLKRKLDQERAKKA